MTTVANEILQHAVETDACVTGICRSVHVSAYIFIAFLFFFFFNSKAYPAYFKPILSKRREKKTLF